MAGGEGTRFPTHKPIHPDRVCVRLSAGRALDLEGVPEGVPFRVIWPEVGHTRVLLVRSFSVEVKLWGWSACLFCLLTRPAQPSH